MEKTDSGAVLGWRDGVHEGHIPKSDTASRLEAYHESSAAGQRVAR